MSLCLVKSVTHDCPKHFLFSFSMLLVNPPEPLYTKHGPCPVVMELKVKGKTVMLYLNHSILFIMMFFGINIDFVTYCITKD